MRTERGRELTSHDHRQEGTRRCICWQKTDDCRYPTVVFLLWQPGEPAACSGGGRAAASATETQAVLSMAGLWGPTVLWVGGNSKCRMRRETGGREYHSGVGGGRGFFVRFRA